jgi:hypothetical protein
MRRVAVTVVALFGFLLAGVFAVYAATPWMVYAQPVTHSHIGDCVLYSVLTVTAFSASIGLFKRKVWAWWIALAGSLLMLAMDGWLLYEAAHSDAIRGADFAVDLRTCATVAIPELISVMALMLPSVRTWFFKRAD